MRRCLPVVLLLLAAPAGWAREDATAALPPPEDTPPVAAEPGDAGEREEAGAPSLREELQAPDAEAQVEVRSYEKKGTVYTEYAIHGHVYMIKVQPPVGPAYYLYDENGDGAFERRLPGGYRHPSPPQWVIKRF